MNGMTGLGKSLIITGLVVLCAGILLFCLGKIPGLGRLPGDIYVQKKNFTFYFPFTTSVLASILISLLIWMFSKR